MQGRIAVGETLALAPSGRTVRVRSLQTFGQKREHVEGGSRVALSVPSVNANDVARGELLVAPQFTATDSFAVEFTPLAQSLSLLRRRNAVRAYIGSAEILGTLVLNEVPQCAVQTAAQIFLRRPTVAYPGTAFVVRRLSPKTLLGGGRIAGVGSQPASPSNERSPHEAIVLTVLRRQAAPATCTQIAGDANLREDAVQAALDALEERGEVMRVLRPHAYVDAELAQGLLVSALQFLQDRQRAEPWAMGVTSIALSRALSVDEALLARILTAFAQDGRVAHRAGYFATPDHVPRLSVEQQSFFEQALSRSGDSFVPTPLSDVVAKVKSSRIPGVSKAFDALVAKGSLVKVGDQLYRGAQLSAIHARLERFLRENDSMTMAQFRDIVGTSRKYAVPLLEWFDARGITVRSGDVRMLRSSRAGAVSEV